MVSIPSSQIKNITYIDIAAEKRSVSKSKSTSWKSPLKEAESNGYFINLNANFLNKTFGDNISDSTQQDDIDSLKRIRLIDLHNHRIQKLKCLEYCRSIVYLNLAKNFITDIRALKHCILLECIDLSSNLIEILPDFKFWNNFMKLKFLYLHDNPISEPESVIGIRSCHNLILLTLWDTPLYLKRKYRHFVVNSIWSLKVLDHHFVSDEEIIEDANFKNSYFKSLSSRLKIDSYLVPNSDDVDYVISIFSRFAHQINVSMAHNSSVLIIQKWIRGFLCRRRLGKGKKSQQLFKKMSSEITTPSVTIPKIITPPIVEAVETVATEKEHVHFEQTKSLKIDMQQLTQTSTIESLEKEAQLLESLMPPYNLMTYRSSTKSVDHDACSPEQIVRALARSGSAADMDIGRTKIRFPDEFSFRLQGINPPVAREPYSEITIEKHRSHYVVREADRLYHDSKMFEKPITKSRSIKKHNSDQLFQNSQSSMALFLLNKWSKADQELMILDRFNENAKKVQRVKKDKEIKHHSVETAKAVRMANIRSIHEEHKQYIRLSLENEKERLKRNMDEVRSRQMDASRQQAEVLKELNFSKQFRAKQAAACNAIEKFERLAMKQDEFQTSKSVVKEAREKMKAEMDAVKSYLENQIQNRQTEKKLEKSALDLQLLQQTNNMINESKMRVEKLKTIRRLVSFQTIPEIQLSAESLPV